MNRREFLNHGALAVAGVTATRDAHAQPSRSAQVPAALDGPTALRLAREKRDELVALLTQLVAVSSPLGESAEPAQRAVSAYLDARGYRSDLVTDDPTAYTSHPDYMAPATPYPAPPISRRRRRPCATPSTSPPGAATTSSTGPTARATTPTTSSSRRSSSPMPSRA